jgi:hypothetical protein
LESSRRSRLVSVLLGSAAKFIVRSAEALAAVLWAASARLAETRLYGVAAMRTRTNPTALF